MNNIIKSITPTSTRIPVKSPFILASRHYDNYPAGNEKMEPTYYIENREIGSDFNLESPWRMYHGKKVPGFPSHPHRGFETVTIASKGFVDHTDSVGSTGRYGNGDVQWLTTGKGAQHCEMFPLLNQDEENPFELFQIWLNLPKKNKMVDPYYQMFWNEDIPIVENKDSNGNVSKVKVIAGDYKDTKALNPNPDSWAAEKENNVTIWTIELEPQAEFTIRAISKTANRTLFYYEGDSLKIEEDEISKNNSLDLAADREIKIKNGSKLSKLLLLEGEPINEPVASYGPFVMNTQKEIMQAFNDYQQTQFGGWPWDRNDPVNPIDSGRFAKYSDGTLNYPKEN